MFETAKEQFGLSSNVLVLFSKLRNWVILRPSLVSYSLSKRLLKHFKS